MCYAHKVGWCYLGCGALQAGVLLTLYRAAACPLSDLCECPVQAIDLIDEAGSRVRLRHAQLPEEARDLDKELRALLKEKDAAVRGQVRTASPPPPEEHHGLASVAGVSCLLLAALQQASKITSVCASFHSRAGGWDSGDVIYFLALVADFRSMPSPVSLIVTCCVPWRFHGR